MPYAVNTHDSLPVAFIKNVGNSIIYYPQERVMDMAYGTLATATLDMTPYPEFVSSGVDSLGLSGERSRQVASGVNFAMIKVMEHSLKRSMRY